MGLPSKSVSWTPSQREDGHVAVGEEVDIARVVQDAGNVGGDEVLAVAHADDDGRTRSRGHNLVRLAQTTGHRVRRLR